MCTSVTFTKKSDFLPQMSDLEDSVGYYIGTYAEIKSATNNAKGNLLPKKSKLRYERTYTTFKEWLLSKRIKEDINETLKFHCKPILTKALLC